MTTPHCNDQDQSFPKLTDSRSTKSTHVSFFMHHMIQYDTMRITTLPEIFIFSDVTLNVALCFLHHAVYNRIADIKLDYQALLKAKYCPRVAAVSRTQKKIQKTHVTLTFDQ